LALQGAALVGAVLEPYVVRSTAVTPFQITLRVSSDKNGRVAGISVSGVPTGSRTERLGVRAGDRILSIDGRPVREFASALGRDSELGRKFLERSDGDRIRLELAPADGSALREVTLEVPAGVGRFHP
jgi:S1-C subfamily serine protease